MIERTEVCPKPGQIKAFDAGWNARELGLDRDTVKTLVTNYDGRRWALLAWDIANSVERNREENNA